MKFFQLLFCLSLLLRTATSHGQDENIIKLPDNISDQDRIAFAMYTVHERTLKLTAQFHPIKNYKPFRASLEIFENGAWVEKAQTEIIYPGYTAPFKIEDWDDSSAKKYRVAYNKEAYYEGIIKKNPIDKSEFVMAAFTCNSMYPEHGGDLPKQDIVKNILKLDPDLIFFSGDQVYEHSEHYLAWLKFGREFGELFRNTPVVIIPDDHDIGQGNLWGAGGIKSPSRRGISGGYYMPLEYIKEVERAQTSHLPDPFDPTPLESGIGVYYTDLKWGGISFAILEDRKFKSGLLGLAKSAPEILPDGPYESIFDPSVDTKALDLPEARLLGQRQLDFLEAWTLDWEGVEMKGVLSQTVLAMINNYSGKYEREILADFDSNAWPQSGRNQALRVIRKSFSVMISGDTHLGAVSKLGVENWNDAGYNFTTPAIANYWLRWWRPKTEGKNRLEGAPNYTGEYLDGFQNKMTVMAVANPTLPEIEEGGKLSTRAAGFGVIRFDKAERTITFECWPRNINIHDPQAKQYPGWPIKIEQTDNYQLKDAFQLPTLECATADRVITVKNCETGEVVSSLRIKGKVYQPAVPEKARYDLLVGEGKNQEVLKNIESKKKNKTRIKLGSI